MPHQDFLERNPKVCLIGKPLEDNYLKVLKDPAWEQHYGNQSGFGINACREAMLDTPWLTLRLAEVTCPECKSTAFYRKVQADPDTYPVGHLPARPQESFRPYNPNFEI